MNTWLYCGSWTDYWQSLLRLKMTKRHSHILMTHIRFSRTASTKSDCIVLIICQSSMSLITWPSSAFSKTREVPHPEGLAQLLQLRAPHMEPVPSRDHPIIYQFMASSKILQQLQRYEPYLIPQPSRSNGVYLNDTCSRDLICIQC